MTIIGDEAGLLIARRLRLEREGRGWSLAELAGRARVAKATISKVERGEMSPTAVTLLRLAGAFDLTLAGLLLRAEGELARLARAADQPSWQDPETGYRRRQVFARPEHLVELASIELPAGARVALPASSYARIRQVVWVLAGQLVISEDGQRRVLEAGDSLGFGAPAEVTLANETAEPTRYLVALART